MAAVEVTISGIEYDKLNRTVRQIVIFGEATLTGLGIGGGPIIPPGQPPTSPGTPTHPIALPGDPWWGGDLKPTHPIMLPGMPGWPDPPPTVPPPGSPPVVIGGSQPVQPMVPPPCIIVDYPGIGKVLVPQPAPPA